MSLGPSTLWRPVASNFSERVTATTDAKQLSSHARHRAAIPQHPAVSFASASTNNPAGDPDELAHNDACRPYPGRCPRGNDREPSRMCACNGANRHSAGTGRATLA
jgi:hypothetical protein